MLIHSFALNAVEITEPVLENAFCKEQEYLRSLDPDRLLAGFRETAGLEKKAERYSGGWEDAEIAGHTLGHYMTALAQLKASAGARDIGDRLEYIVQQLAECQNESGYLSASEEELFDRVERGEPAWVPWYTMHKVLAGLLSAYQLGRLPQALEVAVKLGMWVCRRTDTWTDEVRERVLAVEYGGMNDCLYELYKETGKKEFLEAAAKFDETELFRQVGEGKDVLSGRHANTTIPKFLGALNRYFALGETEEFYLQAAASFFDIVVENHTYITGGNSEGEHFGAPGTLGRKRTRCNCETCNSYNMLKLAEGLYSVTGEKKYIDFYERTFLNAILGSQNPETGMTTYFQPMAAGYFKTYSTPLESFWCCTGTGMESFTKLGSSLYHAGEDRLYVNLYLSSVLHDKKLKLDLTQKTDLNHFDTIRFSLALEEPKRFTLCFRIPEWTNQRFELKINGEPVDYTVKQGYLLLEREWETGSQILLRFFPEITLHALPDAPCSAAVTYGPFVLAAGLGQEEMATERTGVNVIVPAKNVTVREQIRVRNVSVHEWFANCRKNFVKLEGETAFFLFGTDADGEFLFTPYYKHYNDRFAVYFDYCAETGLSESDLQKISRLQAEEAERAAAGAGKVQTALVPAGKKEKKRTGGKGRRVVCVLAGHLAGALLLMVVLYLFAEPVGKGVSKAKGSMDAFLTRRLPGMASVLGVGKKEEDAPVFGDQTEEPEKVKRYVEEPEQYVSSCVLPEGCRAFVTEVGKKEYICIEREGLKVYYPNEVQEDGSKYVYLENAGERAVYFWDYSFDKPELLCPVKGIYNEQGTEQYVFFAEDADRLRIVDAKTLQEHKIISYEKELALLADVGAYAEYENELHIDTVINGRSYLFSVPKGGKDLNIGDYAIRVEKPEYTLQEAGLRFDAYVMSAGAYLGKVVGKLVFSGHAYELSRLDFYAYAEEDYADVGGDSVIHGVTLEEAQRERIALVGNLGENLLVPVKEERKRNLYEPEGFVKDEQGEFTYQKDGKTVSIKGIDVSKYQEKVDWNKVAASGVEFAMIRLGFRGMGTNGTCELDPYFKQNVEGALAAGLEVGVYFFTQAVNVEEAKEEAAFVIESLKGYNITWPVAFDTEEITSYKAARANSLSREVRTACAKAFMEEIAAAGYTPVLYANTRWSILRLDLSELSSYDLWYAYYGDSIYYPYHFTMWQYTASGKVDGVKGNVDMNISFVDYGAKE